MPGDSLNFNTAPKPHKSLESLKENFKQKLDGILYKQLTVENIETFADEALGETISLTDEVLAEYRRNPNVKASPTTLDTKAQEDDAFKILALPNINEILQSIMDVREKIGSLKKYLETNTENINEVITPPQPDRDTHIETSDGSFEKKRMFPRLLTLLYILEHDFDITPNKENVKITEGIVTPKMMRKTPYTRVEIPELNRAVYICDEEGNTSYIFDTTKITEAGLTLEEIDLDDKGDKNSLIAYHPGIGIRINQSKNWRAHIADVLSKSIPEIQTGIPQTHEVEERGKISEFGEKKEFLSFETFQTEVRNLYPKQGDVQVWYSQKRGEHNNWPAAPNVIYKGKGWQGWPELVEKENFMKKERLSFNDFRVEVKRSYSGEKDVNKWYQEEYKRYPKWPSNPDKFYGDEWIGWSELVGRENYKKKKLLSFKEFQIEIKKLYPGEGGVKAWYDEERMRRNKNGQLIHPNWPASPSEAYRDDDWVGFPELVGKENHLKKEFLLFEDFQTEVRGLYSGQTDISGWYKGERKSKDTEGKLKHPNWPAAPHEIYKNKGWVGFPELVGKNKK